MGAPKKVVRKDEWIVIPAAIALRIANLFLCQTFFVADEYWQSVEVAHKHAFGYGHLTWEWEKAIRSSLHPLLFAGLFKLQALLRMDSPYLVTLSPHLLQALLAALCDVCVYKVAHQLWSSRVYARLAFAIHLSSWFSLYCMTRTLSNSLETVLTTAGIFFWLKARKNSTFSRVGLTFGMLSCLVRPTAIFMWLPVATIRILTSSLGPIYSILKEFLPLGSVVLLLSLMCDFLFYGKVVFVQYNFLHFNVFEGVANFYGTHPWHWYFSQGLLVVWLPWIPIVFISFYGILQRTKDKFMKGKAKSKSIIYAVKKLFTLNHQIWILLLIFSEVVAHSFLGHKEFRFILPVLPLTAVLIAPNMLNFWKSKFKILRVAAVVMVAVNLAMAGYFCLLHKRGSLDAVSFLRQELRTSTPSTPLGSVLFLMPCHHTPFYSHIHVNVSMRFLQCQPRIDPSFVNEDDPFHASPLSWVENEYSSGQQHHQLPQYIVLYDVTVQKIDPFLRQHGFQQTAKFFHTHFPEDSDIGTHVVVFAASAESS